MEAGDRVIRSPLWQQIDKVGSHDVSIVGISKHAGKTTVLGRLIADAKVEQRRLGVASIGLDGERVDSLSGIPKPAIWVPEGTLFATAIKSHGHHHVSVRWLEPAGISSPLGEVWIGQAQEEGPIELVGVRQLAHLLALRRRFHELGVAHALFDGALSRMVAVSPEVADGVILAAGAAVGSLEAVMRETEDAVRKLTVPLATEGVATWVRTHWQQTGEVTSNAEISAEVDGMLHRIIYSAGAVTDDLVLQWMGSSEPVELVGRDPTCLFVSREVWRAFLRAGHHLQVLNQAPLIGVAINPASPFGETLDRHQLLANMRAKLAVPVWDVMDQVISDAVDG